MITEDQAHEIGLVGANFAGRVIESGMLKINGEHASSIITAIGQAYVYAKYAALEFEKEHLSGDKDE